MVSIDNLAASEKILARLPEHLKQFIVPQNYEQYTAMDQAVWRFVMRKNTAFLKDVAHESYLGGLKRPAFLLKQFPVYMA
jgi:phenylalanine-4-hydroxylase